MTMYGVVAVDAVVVDLARRSGAGTGRRPSPPARTAAAPAGELMRWGAISLSATRRWSCASSASPDGAHAPPPILRSRTYLPPMLRSDMCRSPALWPRPLLLCHCASCHSRRVGRVTRYAPLVTRYAPPSPRRGWGLLPAREARSTWSPRALARKLLPGRRGLYSTLSSPQTQEEEPDDSIAQDRCCSQPQPPARSALARLPPRP